MDSEARARQLVRARSAGRCELQHPTACRGGADGVHHRVKRGQGGLWSPANLLDACGSGTTGCHGWTEAHPTLAGELGWALPSYADPLTTPCWLGWSVNGAGWWLLDADGCMAWCDQPRPELLTR